ncbi:TrmB family transcriptional regulator [Haloterrigena sp. H1]|uniref:TrmB family transcriptional regulator n=1 Tax=Haloterrigena sp. H1 TaxID=2552943 RepID=UPI00110F17F9|nr:TrmB family transcriptional regulator [Haloterrigena sp. H1]TMT80434.1 TrmB family transcriptional regulator [Haloterrigena sp. H1]
MPIDIDTFEGSSEDTLGGGLTQPERVLSFLASHADQAFRPVEIAGATEIPQNSINSVLRRLEERALVRHKGEYWAITDDRDRLHSLTQYELVTESLNELYGEEDPSEWVEHMPATDDTEKTDNE